MRIPESDFIAGVLRVNPGRGKLDQYELKVIKLNVNLFVMIVI